jgi:sporulation protein YlmC with PRC-barrel domain
MNNGFFDLAGQVLDHELVDANDYPCGQVDDLELEGDPGKTLSVKAILVGPGARIPRLPRFCHAIGKKLFGNEIVRVPWQEVEAITPKLKLKSTALALGLGAADRKAEMMMRRILGS